MRETEQSTNTKKYQNNSGMGLRGIRMDRTKLILIALIKKRTAYCAQNLLKNRPQRIY